MPVCRGGVKQKVFFPFDQVEDFFQIPALQRGQAVMFVTLDRTFGVEKTHIPVSPVSSDHHDIPMMHPVLSLGQKRVELFLGIGGSARMGKTIASGLRRTASA